MTGRDYEQRRNATPGRRMAMSAAWRRASKAFLAEPGNGICGHCRAAPSTCVDHRVPHKGDPALFWNRANWIPSCGPCNSAKAAGVEGAFGNPVKPGVAFRRRPINKDVTAEGFPTDPLHPWNNESC